MRYDENYFQNGKNQDEPKSIQSALLDGEQVLWSGKPQRKAFIVNNVLKMLPVALLWLVFDTFFIVMLTKTADMLPVPAIVFLCIFFVFHPMPVWMWIYRCATASKRHKNIEYAFTNSYTLLVFIITNLFAIFNTICAAQNTIARNKRAIWIFCIIDILL